jgi:hypothetical protein
LLELVAVPFIVDMMRERLKCRGEFLLQSRRLLGRSDRRRIGRSLDHTFGERSITAASADVKRQFDAGP